MQSPRLPSRRGTRKIARGSAERLLHKLVGYCDRWSVRSGDRIGFMVSSAEDAPFTLRFVRHLCADPNPPAPATRTSRCRRPCDGAAGRTVPAGAGSGSFGALRDCSRTRPGVLRSRRRSGRLRRARACRASWRCVARAGVLLSRRAERRGDAEGGGRRQAAFTRPVVAASDAGAAPVPDLAAAIAPRRTAARCASPAPSARPHREAGEGSGAGSRPAGGRLVRRDARSAAARRRGRAGNPAHRTASWNGRRWGGRGGDRALLARQRGAVPPAGNARLARSLGFFARHPDRDRRRLGPRAAHARLRNLPTRAMTGSDWTGARA